MRSVVSVGTFVFLSLLVVVLGANFIVALGEKFGLL